MLRCTGVYNCLKQNQARRSKAVLWKQTPEFNDTFVTYAYYAGHAVNMVSVENFDYFLNCLCEPSQQDSQIIEVLFLYTFYLQPHILMSES